MSVVGGGCYDAMEFGMSRGIKPKRNMCAFQMKKKLGAILDSPPKGKREGRKIMFYLTTHSTHFIYGYMASNIW